MSGSRFLCIHSHFYQPPRENPWIEEVELQESAFPHHDWSERISAECYLVNGERWINDDAADGSVPSYWPVTENSFGAVWFPDPRDEP